MKVESVDVEMEVEMEVDVDYLMKNEHMLKQLKKKELIKLVKFLFAEIKKAT